MCWTAQLWKSRVTLRDSSDRFFFTCISNSSHAQSLPSSQDQSWLLILKNKRFSCTYWCTPAIPTMERQRQSDYLWVGVQLVYLASKYQASQKQTDLGCNSLVECLPSSKSCVQASGLGGKTVTKNKSHFTSYWEPTELAWLRKMKITSWR